jgi:hypothetical protein
MYSSIYSFIFLLLSLKHRACVKSFVSLQFLNFRQSVGLLWRGISQWQGRCLHRAIQTQNKRRQTSMPRVRFEPTIPVFEAGEESSCLRLCGHVSQQINVRKLAIEHVNIIRNCICRQGAGHRKTFTMYM